MTQNLPITDVCLNVTEECNLACKYCFTEHHPNYMTLDVAKDAAKWLYNNAIESSKIQEKEVIPTIGFFGGEPTLMWDSIIVPLISWIEEQNWKFNFGITSNSVLDASKISPSSQIRINPDKGSTTIFLHLNVFNTVSTAVPS